jgi:putative Ca2+/H+ antiporter (TMEM165/GDT1 family)
MDWKIFATVFTSVFLAELADKTQFMILAFSADKPASPLSVFAGACAALIVASALGVLAGAWLGAHINMRYLTMAAGVLFIGLGVWTLRSALA